MAVIETWLRQDLKGLVTVRSLQGQVFSLDNGGNLIGVKVTKDGRPVTLTGTVTGYCILSDGQTVTVTGSGSSGIQNGNEAYIVLPQLVYSVPGQISIVIKLTSGSVTTTLAACTGYVYRSRTSNEVVPPGTPIPDLATMEEVIRRATAATESANTAATGAENVNASMTKEGDVITIAVTDRDGNVMTETMTDTASDVSKLKSSFEQLNDNVIVDSAGPAPIVSVTDGADGMPMRKVEVAIEPVQDLHGYDAPWPAGGGKNVFYHEGNITSTANGLTATFDGDSQAISITGTNTGTSAYVLLNIPCTAEIPRETPLSRALINIPSGVYVNLTYKKNGTWYGVNNGGTIPSETDTGTTINFQIGIYASATTLNVSGLHIQIERGSTAPTAWTPYSNICPITGWTGVKVTKAGANVLDIARTAGTLSGNTPIAQRSFEFDKYYVGMSANNYYYQNRVNEYHVNNPKGEVGITTTWSAYGVAFPIRVKPNTAYYITATAVKGSPIVSVGFFDKDGWYLSSKSDIANTAVTTPDKCTIMNVVVNGNDTNGVALKDLSFNYPATDHDYHEPHVDTYDITFPSSSGTIYGGTLTVNEDGTGQLVVDRAEVDLGTLNWNADSNRPGVFYTNGVANSAKAKGKIIADIYKNRAVSVPSASALASANNSISLYESYGSGYVYTINISKAGMTANEYKTAMSGVKAVYELKGTARSEYTITSLEVLETLKGVNNVWADCGDLSITYPADTKMYIDNRINSTRKLIAGIETDFEASKAYSVGDMLIIGDDLYKVASAIASGATITVGTNVNKTTVAEQLLALANA